MTDNRYNLALALGFTCVSAVVMQTGKALDWFTLVKKPLSILKPLQDLDRSKLAPYRVARVRSLGPDTIQELGTQEYIDWALENPVATTPWAAAANLFVTYYTGVTDQVPHVPEECLQQGAFSLDKDDPISLKLPRVGREVSVRRLTFSPPGARLQRGDSKQTTVYYIFSVNGEFLSTRTEVRNRMLDPGDKHLYYSKIEIAFSRSGGPQQAELDKAAAELLDIAVAELSRTHWPPPAWARIGPPRPGG